MAPLLTSFAQLRNPVDLVILAISILLVVFLLAKAWLTPHLCALAKRTSLCMASLFVLTVALRLLLLPQSPVPIPTGADDFSYLLLGDTLAHFRLANPQHPFPQFFESVFTLQQPAYASIYPLGQGIVLAFGQLVFHNPWAGVLLSSAAFAALCYWMLRAWVTPIWALTGGALAIFQFGPLNPWVNSYWGGSLSACAGCLIFGGLPRMRQSPRVRYGLLLATGFALQLLTRPFEAIFLALAIAFFLFFAFRQTPLALLRPAIAAAAILAPALGLMLLQNKAVTHSWTTMPYQLSRYQYGVPATFTFQPNPIPHRQLTPEQQLDYRAQAAIHGPATDIIAAYFQRLVYRLRYLPFFLPPPLYLALLWFLPNARQPKYLWAAGTVLLFALGTNFYPYFFPQYLAALTCVFVLFGVAGLQNLRGPAGSHLAILCAASFLFWFGIYASSDTHLFALTTYQSWHYINRGDTQGRIAIQQQLDRSPGTQLVFVRYAPTHRFEEWIHNDADTANARTVWAGDLGTEENQQLLHFYPNRNAWLLQPDLHPPLLTPYPRESGPFLTVQ